MVVSSLYRVLNLRLLVTMTKKALITGINGMDGRLLAKVLLDKGYTVVGMSRNGKPSNDSIDNVIYLYGDLFDSSSIIDILTLVEPDEIYNLGAQSAIKPSWGNPKYTLQVNGVIIVDILEWIKEKSPKTKLFNAASSEMFGYTNESPQTEDTKLYPRNPYGSAKIYAHNMIRHYREEYGIFACSGILYNHESTLRDISMVTRKITNGVAKIHLGLSDNIELGNLDAVRDWGYASDYCEGMWTILQHDKADDYIISSGVSRTIKDFLDVAFSVVGITSWDKYVTINEKFVRPVESFTLVGDNSKLKSIGWKPKTTFEEMLREMVSFDIEKINYDKDNIPV